MITSTSKSGPRPSPYNITSVTTYCFIPPLYARREKLYFLKPQCCSFQLHRYVWYWYSFFIELFLQNYINVCARNSFHKIFFFIILLGKWKILVKSNFIVKQFNFAIFRNAILLVVWKRYYTNTFYLGTCRIKSQNTDLVAAGTWHWQCNLKVLFYAMHNFAAPYSE